MEKIKKDHRQTDTCDSCRSGGSQILENARTILTTYSIFPKVLNQLGNAKTLFLLVVLVLSFVTYDLITLLATLAVNSIRCVYDDLIHW